MKNLLLFSGFIGLVGLVACEEHEVIPPPVPLVDLNCSCNALIDDTSYTYKDTCTYASEKVIGTPGISSARYFSNVEDFGFDEGVQLEIRALEWTDNGTNKPTIDQWQTFFNNNLSPKYYPENVDPADAVIVTWTDPDGNVWTSDSSDLCLSNFTFNSFIQESDTTGDYMKFDASFNCTLWNSSYTASKCLEGGHIKSAFRLD